MGQILSHVRVESDVKRAIFNEISGTSLKFFYKKIKIKQLLKFYIVFILNCCASAYCSYEVIQF